MKLTLQQFEIYNIRAALLLFVLTPFLLIMIFAGWYSLYNLEAQGKARMQEDIELIARAIQKPLSYALEHGRSGSMKQTVTSAFDFNRVYGIYVYNKQGKRIATSGSPKALVRTEKAAVLASKGDHQSEFEKIGADQVFSYFLPLTDSGGRINGLLQVTRHGRDFVNYLERMRMQSLSILAVFLLLLTGVVYAGHHNAIGRYMKHMQNSMKRISHGEFQHRITLRGPSEIRFLSKEINNMLDSIANAELKIAQQRENEFDLKTRLHQSEKLAAIGRFSTGVAHELGAPLSVADGKLQQLLRKQGKNSSKALVPVRTELRRMELIIRQLMDFARPAKPERCAVSADHLARSALSQISDECQRRGIEIMVSGPKPAPILHGDRLRLEQALINLLRNAVQASSKGKVRLSWANGNNDTIEFSVEDDGAGVNVDIIDRVFEPFFTTKPTGKGTGLGLAVVVAVLSEHGGRVEIGRSSLGGALFRLFFPKIGATEREKKV
jgi:signal transduction histidine kinase